jgi:hypothetical protein
MRFLKDGPSIPDDLLIARDEGRVVFFCGAGVSKARAGLLDFFDLAEEVIRRLGVTSDNAASLILNEARDIHKRTGVSGLISVDGIFGLLERDFLTRDIEETVSKALKPGNIVDLSAHRIILDLAKTLDGKVRLITTNFDLLFEDCCKSLKILYPPKLPDPSKHNEMDGVIHLHGCVNRDYSGPEGNSFILSSSQFGEAYLSTGWATNFIKEIIDRYVVLFIGYTADDPPIKYLLEAINKKPGRLNNIYAFQDGLSNDSTVKWQQKGVEAISYLENEGHRTLWDTLSAWAERAKNQDAWYKSVIDRAKNGPAQLQPHERGQVAHLISTVDGVRRFSEGNDPPSAEWLCVFDPSCRYGRPRYNIQLQDEEKSFIDPFDFYGLDEDLVPKKIDPNKHFEKRHIPPTAWDAFEANRLDRQNLKDDSFASIRGHLAMNAPRLSPRLVAIGDWIMNVANQPAAIWWAANQNGLHPNIQDSIQWKLRNSNEDSISVIRNAWTYLFEFWKKKRKDSAQDAYQLKIIIDKDGWSNKIIRELATIYRPYLKIEHNYLDGPVPPKIKKDISLREMLQLDVEYPLAISDLNIPDEWLESSVREFRKNLELALQLETEIGGYGLHNISPIIRDNTVNNSSLRIPDLSGSIIFFSSLFERLITFNITLANREFNAWPVNDDTIFSHLRIWAAGWNELISDEAFGSFMVELSDNAFWASYHQRDLLITLAKRWTGLGKKTRQGIENRLLQGRSKREWENDDEFRKNKARDTADRLLWLANNGCEFNFDLSDEIGKLKQIAPEWKPEYISKATNSDETKHSSLSNEPIGNILKKAQELSDRADNFPAEKNPFASLCDEKPMRAFAALTYAAKRNEYPEWAWRTFLSPDARKNDKSRLTKLIAERILKYPNEKVANFVRPVSNWLLDVSQSLSSSFPETFDKIILKLINILRLKLPGSSTSIIRDNKEIDWAMEALNAPAGTLAQVLFRDNRKKILKSDGRFLIGWLKHIDELLSLHGDLRRHALVIFAYHLNWFYFIDPIWTETNLVSVLDSDDESDKSAVWSGFFWHAIVPKPELYIRLKPHLLLLARQSVSRGRKYSGVLAGFILAGWGFRDKETGERLISNDEMREVLLYVNDEFRIQIIWQAERWSENEGNESDKNWWIMVLELLRDVWPRQKSAKTPKISAALCNLVFSNTDNFPEISEVILPLISKIERDHMDLYKLTTPENKIIDWYPKQTLAILYAVLPDNVSIWPYDIDTILKRLGEADENLKKDERFLEIIRKWHSR